MKYLSSAVLALCALSACGAKGPVTDNPAILGDWSCKSELSVQGVQLRSYSNSNFSEDGRYVSRGNLRMSGFGSRAVFDVETKETWQLVGGQLQRRRAKQKILSASGSGPEFSGMSEAELKRAFSESGDVPTGPVLVTDLTLETLVFTQRVADQEVVTNCQRPEAARAAALAATGQSPQAE